MVTCKNGETRRDFLTVVSVLGLDVAAGGIGSPALAQPENERPKEGDVLVSIDSESPVPLQPKDIPTGGPPVLAWPMDSVGNLVRKGSRLNKVLLVRLDPATLVGLTQERAADGVVAYSAICPHAGCEVGVWVDDQKISSAPAITRTIIRAMAPRCLTVQRRALCRRSRSRLWMGIWR